MTRAPGAGATPRERASRRAAHPLRPAGDSGTAFPPPWALWALGAWAALLLLAPPLSNACWALDGFRSVPPAARVGLLLVAALVAVLPVVRSRAWALWGAAGLALAAVVAFPLRERIHVLGDTDLRLRAMAGYGQHAVYASLGEWAHRLHASPLDLGVDFLLPVTLDRAGVGLGVAVSLVSMLLAFAFLAGAWRVARRLPVAPELRGAVTAALVLAGTLELFAGYAESTGILLAAAAWWWAEMLTPLASRRQALRTVAAWLVLFFCHRVALLMLVPLAWRGLGPPLEGDRPSERRALLGFGALAVAIAALVLSAGAEGQQLVADASELLSSSTGGGFHPPSALDLVNVLALTAPLLVLAPLLAGGGALRRLAGRPEAWLIAVAALPLLPLVLALPNAPSGLGYHRDWDLGALFGWTLTLGGVAALAQLSAARLRGALVVLLPVLALGAGGWLAVNAHEGESMRRALVLASKPPLMPGPQLGHLHVYLGQRAMNLGQPLLAARYYERAFALIPNPRHALFAAEAWAMAGDPRAARADVALARSRGALQGELARSADELETLIARAAADSAQAARAATGAARDSLAGAGR